MKTLVAAADGPSHAWRTLPVWACLIIMRDNSSLAWRMNFWRWNSYGEIEIYTSVFSYRVSRNGYVY